MDPVTTALLVAQGLAGLGKAGYGAYQQQRGRQALDAAYEAPTGKPSEYAEMLKQAKQSEQAQRRLDEINRSMASSTAALQQAGSRGVIGGIGAVTEAGSRARTGVLTAQQQEIMRALQLSAQGSENERSRQLLREDRERRQAQAAISAGVQNIAGGIGDIAGSLATGIDVRSGNKTTGTSTDTDTTVSPFAFEQEGKAAKNAKGIIGGPTSEALTDAQLEEVAKLLESYKSFKSGGVQKTPGEFSHSKNPIDIMKEGAKIGEMTGGEYIFNPSQAKQMKKLASSGNTDLHKFVKSLLNKPQFK